MLLLILYHKQKSTVLRAIVGSQKESLNHFCMRQFLEQTLTSFEWNHGQLVFSKKHKKRNQTQHLGRS